ncbi:MAG: ABC transporter substrate-binding protein [Thermomicrobiales bacterium]
MFSATYRVRAVLLAALMLVTSAGALGTTSAQAERPTLRLGIASADLQTLDPHFAAGTQDRTVVDMIFNGLVRYAPGNAPTIEADLATEIPEPVMEGTSQVWTFALREGVMCHPSASTEAYELTADDVVYSLEKSANVDRSAYAADYAGMSVAKVDDYTVAITMETPLSPELFLPKVANYSGGFIVCSQAVEALGDEAFRTAPVGTGPFMFSQYTPQNAVTLLANDDYFRGQPLLAGVEARYIADSTSLTLGLQAGELDVIDGLNEAQWVDQINGEDGLVADIFGVGEVTFVNFNTTVAPLDNLQVRQAIAYALNRDDFVALSGEPVAEAVYSVVPAQLMEGGLTQEQAATADVEYAYDIERAQQLMEEAGFADGFELELVTSEMDAYRRVYEVMQESLSEIGIELQVNVVDHATMHEQIRLDVNPITVYNAFRPNADVYFTQFFSGAEASGTMPNTNFAAYEAIDALITEARAETDPAAQAEIWRQANVQILTDMAAFPINLTNLVYGRAEGVDYGHELVSSLALYPQVTELTTIAQ